VTQARVPAGSSEGGRFASVECPTTYRLLAALRPEEECRPDPDNPARTIVPAPKCPHGHYRRWADAIDPATKAQPNCRKCHPSR
jgi:hypothetical protein